MTSDPKRVSRPPGVTRTALLLFLAAVFFSGIACNKRARPQPGATPPQAGNLPSRAFQTAPAQALAPRININTASAKELETLPGIGKALAERITEHREKYGLFRRPEHLIIVRGISDKRFRALRDLVTVE